MQYNNNNINNKNNDKELYLSVDVFSSLQCRHIFGKQTLSSSSRNLKAEEGWGEIDISTKGVVDR